MPRGHTDSSRWCCTLFFFKYKMYNKRLCCTVFIIYIYKDDRKGLTRFADSKGDRRDMEVEKKNNNNN